MKKENIKSFRIPNTHIIYLFILFNLLFLFVNVNVTHVHFSHRILLFFKKYCFILFIKTRHIYMLLLFFVSKRRIQFLFFTSPVSITVSYISYY